MFNWANGRDALLSLSFRDPFAVAHEEGVSLGIYPPFVEKGVRYSVFKYTLSEKVYHIAKSLALLDMDTWKKVKVDGAEVAPVRPMTGKPRRTAAVSG